MAIVVIVVLLAAIGHTVLWVTLVNRMHGFGIPRKWVHALSLLCMLAFAIIPVAILVAMFGTQLGLPPSLAHSAIPAVWFYSVFCVAVCLGSVLQRWYWSKHPERSSTLLSNHTTHVRVPDAAAKVVPSGALRLLARLPGNQVFEIRTQEKELAIPRLAAAHDGLRIAHVTDLHMSGRIAQSYYDHVVDEVNGAAADIVAITGDIVEGDQFLEWIPPTLGRLRARYGVYYVLGNHDRRATEARLKSTLADAGLIHVGSVWRQLTLNNAPLVIVGNELPWYKPAADLSDCPTHESTGWPTRVLLAHSPDQFRWAQENDVDLMLAGHLHGGQVRLPLLGAFLAPSLLGVRYAAGVFTAGNTTMHVSRGTGSLTPVRYGCPPEIAVLVLRPARR